MNTVTVTSGNNGYPNNLYDVLVADTVTELNELLSQHGGELILLKQRAGWQFYECKGTHYGTLLDMPGRDSDTVIRYRKGDNIENEAFQLVIGSYDNAAAALADIYPDDTIEQLMAKLKVWQERIEEITSAVTEGEDCDIWMNNPDPTYIDYVVTAESVDFTSDVWTYRLAVRPDNF